ncbi:hypothetical protein [Streptomyces decoyicus]|uniref:hypothetical protein n=1 Tax=Streptomyces decoyicus TaxID=249567 RepID=UPI003868B9D7
MARSQHQSVNDYVAARQAGDAKRASQIAREVAERFATRTTDGSEAAEIFDASLSVPLGSQTK